LLSIGTVHDAGAAGAGLVAASSFDQGSGTSVPDLSGNGKRRCTTRPSRWAATACRAHTRRPGSFTSATGPAAVPLTTWKFVAATYDGSTIRVHVVRTQPKSAATSRS